jgi:hypothetical protein
MKQSFTLEERLYKTEEGEIVKEGDPRAATIYRGPGQKIPHEEAVALGLVEGDAAAEVESEGKHSGKLLVDLTDEELVDHFLDTLEEIDGRDLDEEQLVEKVRERVPGWLSEAEPDAAGESGQGLEETVDLSKLSRAELDKKAAELGIESPDKIKGGKPKVIEAIEAKLAEA